MGERIPMPESGQGGWVALPPDEVPEEWRARATVLLLVPLLPDEARHLLGTDRALPGLDPEDQPLVRLAARGMATRAIARELSLTPRTVQRRLGRLRRRFGLADSSELATFLARRGF